MKNALRKSAVREIKNTRNRFLSIFGIVALGVGFFSGVKASAPDMRRTADKYLDDSSLMNYRLVSTYGFDEKDIEALKQVEGAEVFASYYADLMAAGEGVSPDAARVFSLPDEGAEINNITLTGGRMPEKAGECITAAAEMDGTRYTVGSIVTFTDGDGESPEDMLNLDTYTVVGTFISPMYVDKTSYGSAAVGDGSIGAVFYIPEENFSVEYNTEVYLRFPELDGLNCYSDEYKDRVEEITERLEAVAERRQDGRYEDIIDEANETLAEAKQELADAEAEANAEIADGEKELADAKIKLDDAAKEIADAEQKLADGEQELIDGEKELEDGRKELADGIAEYEKEIADAEQKIADGEKEIAENEQKLIDGEKEYQDGLAEFNEGYEKFLDGKKQYEDGLAEYEKGRAELDKSYAEWEKGKAEYEQGMTALQDSEKQLDDAGDQLSMVLMAYGADSPVYLAAKAQFDEAVAAYSAGKAQLEAAKKELDEGKILIDEGYAQLDLAKAELDEAKKTLDESEIEIEKGKAELDKAALEIEDGKKQLEEGKQTLADSKKELEQAKIDAEKEFADARQKLADGEKELEDGRQEIEDAKKELADGKKEYEDGLKEYADGEKELQDGKAEAEEKIADAKKELADAEQEIADLEKPEWYIFTRDDNPGYSEYGENANRINNIAAVFPVFFILVAALVCLTTMSRMVEEQRTQIGTLKALGYTNGEIIFKYMFYAAAATFTGAVTGVLLGMQLFPTVIILAYGMMYNIPELCTPIDIPIALGAIGASLAAILLTVFFTCKSALSEQAAQLMRPKAPKVGKRILLERITPVWKHFNFSNKVTARNLFRYKRKMFMSTVGIAGCTALLVTGFALYDSINDIIRLQYGEIQFYDGIAVYDGEKYPDADKAIAEIKESFAGGGSVSVYQKQMTVAANGKDVDAYIAVPSDSEAFSEFFTLRSRQTGEKYALTDGTIYIDEKMSLLLDGVKGGDTLSIKKSDTETIDVTLTAFFENYPGHFVYMTESTYVDLFGEKPVYNALYFSHTLGEAEEDALAEEILRADGALTVSFTTEMKKNYTSMLDTLSYVIIVIIVAAGALAYIVMYNLTNINITERIREIATLKVLGFYDGEVDAYIFRENILLTILGTLAGLVLGAALAIFVITTAEVDLVMFGRNIYAKSYILAAIFTLLFSVLVTLVMHKKLKQVDMIEALKSVE